MRLPLVPPAAGARPHQARDMFANKVELGMQERGVQVSARPVPSKRSPSVLPETGASPHRARVFFSGN